VGLPLGTDGKRSQCEDNAGQGINSHFSWMKRLDGWGLFIFAAGSAFLYGANQLRVAGVLMVLSFLMANFIRFPSALAKVFPAPWELLFFSAWVIWAGSTGFLAADDRALYLRHLTIIVQMMVMVWTAYAILGNQKSCDVVFLALAVGGGVQLAAAATGGAFSGGSALTAERAMGLTSNANTLGFRMLYMLFCAALFWHTPLPWRRMIRLAILGLFPAAAYVIAVSGSRKSALAFALLLFSWVYVIPQVKTARFRRVFGTSLALAVLSGLLVTAAPVFLENTALGNRFAEFLERGRTRSDLLSEEQTDLMKAAEANSRYAMYTEGLRIFLEHPVFGVGLYNFGRYFSAGWTHSDYMEPLVTTGFIGFLLYHSFYWCVLLRSLRVMKSVADPQTLYRLKMSVVGVLLILFLGFGTPHYTSQPTFLLLTALSAYSWRVHREILQAAQDVRIKRPIGDTFGRKDGHVDSGSVVRCESSLLTTSTS